MRVPFGLWWQSWQFIITSVLVTFLPSHVGMLVLRRPATQEFAWEDCRQKGGIISVQEVLNDDQIVTQLLTPEKEIWADVTAYLENDQYYWGNDNTIQGLDFHPLEHVGDCIYFDWRETELLSIYCTKKHGYICSFEGPAAENENCLPTNCISDGNEYYMLFDERLSWYESSNKCKTHGGLLASFHDFHSFRNILEKRRLQLDSHSKLWTSGTNIIWKNDVGDKVDRFYWLPNEPALVVGENNCVAYAQRNYYFKWKIEPCSYKLPYICKNDVGTIPSTSSRPTGNTNGIKEIDRLPNSETESKIEKGRKEDKAKNKVTEGFFDRKKISVLFFAMMLIIVGLILVLPLDQTPGGNQM